MIRTLLVIRLIKDFLVLLVMFFITHFFVEIDIIDGSFSSYLMAIGLFWFVGIFLFLPFEDFPYCLFAFVFAIALFSIGAIFNQNIKPMCSDEELGSHPQCQWALLVTYEEDGYIEYDNFDLTGTAEEAEQCLQYFVTKYHEQNPNIKIISLRKTLLSVPEEHARKLGAENFY